MCALEYIIYPTKYFLRGNLEKTKFSLAWWTKIKRKRNTDHGGWTKALFTLFMGNSLLTNMHMFKITYKDP